uniref:Hemicentin-1 n=1 Tax=Ciona savignyi TaxID=51511 RepID=H2YTM3_CIOSA
MTDAGEYTCIAFNDAGSVDRKVSLVLEMAPRFVLVPENHIADAGNNVVLDCEAVGEPAPTISWTKGSRQLPQDDRYSVLRNNSLRIVASRLEDTGEYECLASNIMGLNQAKALLTVRVIIKKEAQGIAFGTINDIPFGGSEISANGTNIGDDKTRIIAELDNIPPSVGPALKSQIAILSPIGWTMAREIQEAYNGYTLTGGEFNRDVMVEFASGDVVKMTHHVHGVNSQGKLQMDVSLEGTVPEVHLGTDIELKDYTEDYLQTDAGELYAYSDRLLVLDGYILPYTWNHSITYNSSRGLMPFLVETLSVTDIVVDYDEVLRTLRFQMDVQIGPGNPSDRCPTGFLLESSGRYCRDNNECSTNRPCSHTCTNVPGSFVCGCPDGFSMGPDGRNCEDVDECGTGQYICRPTTECLNTLGSYRCVIRCGFGLKRSENGRTCEDIDECATGRHECGVGMQCQNTEGGYTCDCRPGFKASGIQPPCVDINECLDYRVSPCPHECVNTIGSFECICPLGLRYLADDKSCVGLVRLPNNVIQPVQTPILPQRGTLTLISQHNHRIFNPVFTLRDPRCGTGYRYSAQQCRDIDECRELSGICQYSCNNSLGSYSCLCPRGYRVADNGRNCEDIDECAEGLMHCLPNQMCFNKRGSVTCINTPCPPSYVRVSSNGYCLKQCVGRNCHTQPRYAIEYKTVALPFGIGANQDLVRLAVYTSDDQLHRNTRFVAKNTFQGPFDIRTSNHKGVVYTTRALNTARTYHLEAQATSFTYDNTRIEYQTKFIIYISVAGHRF